jgi:glycine oxidase
MTSAVWDAIIVGQGLAGTTLAWQLTIAGQRVLVVDREDAVTSSKIAAGLITPITGHRLALGWQGTEVREVARQFYRSIETRTQRTFFHDRTAVRLFKSDFEREQWAQRRLQTEFQAYLVTPQPAQLFDPDVADATGGGFQMHAAQLDVAAYLDASRASLAYASMAVDWARDVTFDGELVSLQSETARYVISCEGFAATRNPYFSGVPFQAARGDVLTVRFPRPLPSYSLHRGLWVAPTSEPNVFRVGSTYDREQLDTNPSPTARFELEQSLRAFIRLPFTVIDHQAAVRPIIQESRPRIGVHPLHPQLGYFNGLGSKGSLYAPSFAQYLTAHIVHRTPLLAAHDVQRILKAG